MLIQKQGKKTNFDKTISLTENNIRDCIMHITGNLYVTYIYL